MWGGFEASVETGLDCNAWRDLIAVAVCAARLSAIARCRRQVARGRGQFIEHEPYGSGDSKSKHWMASDGSGGRLGAAHRFPQRSPIVVDIDMGAHVNYMGANVIHWQPS
jgi:hypothetical protein